jgi:hypothetical protein
MAHTAPVHAHAHHRHFFGIWYAMLPHDVGEKITKFGNLRQVNADGGD